MTKRMREHRCNCLILFTFLLTLTVPIPSFAQSPQPGTEAADARARELFQNGALLYDEGRYEDAIVAWEEAYRLSPRPLLLFNMANAMERLARWEDALAMLNRYRAFAGAEERDTLDRRMRNIERRVEELKRNEREEQLAREAAAKKAEDERLAAERAAAEKAAAERAANESGGDGGGRVDKPRSSNRHSSSGSGTAGGQRGPNPAGVILLGVGLGGVGVGGVFGGLALQARDEAGALCTVEDPVLCPATAADPLGLDARWSLASDISLVAGGAVAATGLVITIVDAARRPKASAVRIIPLGGRDHAALLLSGRF